MKLIENKIEELKKNGYQLDFGVIFEAAFENYKKIAIYGGVIIIVFSILFVIALTAIAVSVFGAETITEFAKPENLNPANFSPNFLIGYMATTMLITCILSPFQAGFLKMADCGEKGEEFHVSTMFSYYKLPYISSIILSTLIITLMSTGVSLLLEISGIKIVGGFISITVTLLTFLTIPFIIFGKLNAIDAIKSSIAIVAKQPLLFLGLIIVSGIAALTGLIAFCIGIFFTIPFVFSMNYVIYKNIVGIEDEVEKGIITEEK